MIRRLRRHPDDAMRVSVAMREAVDIELALMTWATLHNDPAERSRREAFRRRWSQQMQARWPGI